MHRNGVGYGACMALGVMRVLRGGWRKLRSDSFSQLAAAGGQTSHRDRCLRDGNHFRLFDSLSGLRDKGRDGAVHLGFGLRVVKLVAGLHRGRVDASDLPAGDGVEFALHLRGAVEILAGAPHRP